MTKLWCTICNETDFGVTPPKPDHVLRHMRYVHQLPLTISDPADRKLWQDRQNSMWDERQKQLRAGMDSNAQLETMWSKFKKSELERELKRHLAVHDDDESEAAVSSDDPEMQEPGKAQSADVVRAAETLMAMRDDVGHANISMPFNQPRRYSKDELDSADAMQALKTGTAGVASSTTEEPDSSQLNVSKDQQPPAAVSSSGRKPGSNSVSKRPKNVELGR